MSVCLFVRSLVCLQFNVFVHIRILVCLCCSYCLFIWLCVCLCVFVFVRLFVCVCLSVCVCVHLFVEKPDVGADVHPLACTCISNSLSHFAWTWVAASDILAKSRA